MPQEDLASLCRAHPALVSVLGTILDRSERQGRVPRTITVAETPELHSALLSAFSARFVRPRDGRLRVDLAAACAAHGDAGSEKLLTSMYGALARAPRDPEREARTRRASLERSLGELLAQAASEPSRAFVRTAMDGLARDRGTLVDLARTQGAEHASRLARDVVRAVDAALVNPAPVRVQTFAAKTLGSSKALRTGSDLLKLVSSVLYDLHPETRARVHDMGEPSSAAAARALALEARGVYRDEVAASVLCFGPIVYRKGRERFDQVARHAALGESSRLIQHQLRDAALERPAARRVTIFENLTPYLDYVDALVQRRARDEIVVHSGGQASWAVVRLVELCARHALPMRHAGDLDRAGISIARSLAHRTGARIRPLCMDVATHRRYADRGQPLSPAEAARLAQQLAHERPERAGHALLREIARTGIWIEQEAFADERLAEVIA